MDVALYELWDIQDNNNKAVQIGEGTYDFNTLKDIKKIGALILPKSSKIIFSDNKNKMICQVISKNVSTIILWKDSNYITGVSKIQYDILKKNEEFVYNNDRCVNSENSFNGVDVKTKKVEVKKTTVQNDILEQIKNFQQINEIDITGCSSIIQIFDKQNKEIMTIDGECTYTFGEKILNTNNIGKILGVSNIPKRLVNLNESKPNNDIKQVDIQFNFKKYTEYFSKNKDKIIKISSTIFIWILTIYILKQIAKL
jgi:peroxiredoxin family protein